MYFKPVIHGIFDQLKSLVSTLPNEDYSRQLPVLNNASIGQHVRHTLEFFKCLFEGCEEGVVNYDDRRRDLFLESNTLEALNCLNNLINQIEELEGDSPIKLMQHYGAEAAFEIDSNLFRELIYNIEHAVHHMALIRVGIQYLNPAHQLPTDFGVASSTIKFRESQFQRN